MERSIDNLKLSHLLLIGCLLHTVAILGVATAIHSEPSENVLLVPRDEGLFIVGENKFGLTRIKSFEHMPDVEAYLKDQNMHVPELTEAHLYTRGRLGETLSAHRLTWADNNDKSQKTPIVETNNAETAKQVQNWITRGNLKNSKLGFAIPLEPNSEASFGP